MAVILQCRGVWPAIGIAIFMNGAADGEAYLHRHRGASGYLPEHTLMSAGRSWYSIPLAQIPCTTKPTQCTTPVRSFKYPKIAESSKARGSVAYKKPRVVSSIERSLSMDVLSLNKARRALVQASLIAYDQPLYQVLALDRPCALDNPTRRRDELRSLRQWLVEALEKGP